MRYHTFLLKYGEIGIKGKNRYIFENALVDRIRDTLKGVEGRFQVHKSQGRIYVECFGEYDFEETVSRLKRIFGLVGICPVVRFEDEGIDKLRKDMVEYVSRVHPRGDMSFKVEARRAKKTYPRNSMEINCELGEAILEAFPRMKVDVHHPEVMFHVEIRDDVYVYSRIIPGAGGMPVGTNGRATLLLSGGIDSPVAGYMVARRGVEIDAVYFHAPPYTSERARGKVIELAEILSSFAGNIRLYVVNFTDIQLYIYDQCPHEELTILMRRYMMRIAQHFADERQSLGLITGESIGQVASQTMHSLAVTNAVCHLPVYRPLIGCDKQEIVSAAEKIGTFETSIQPFEDCCTIFVAKHPVTKPDMERIEKSESRLGEKIDDLVSKAIDSVEVINIQGV